MLSTIYSSIPASIIPAVEAAINQTIVDVVTEVTLLSGGLSGALVFRICTADHSFLLKLLTPTVFDNPDTFFKYKLAAGAGVAPKLYYADNLNGILITDLIKGQPHNAAFTAGQTIVELANLIKTLHDTDFPPNYESCDLQEVFDQSIAWFTDRSFFAANPEDYIYSKYKLIKEIYPWHYTDKVLTHNDLNPGNVLCDGKRLWLIDWDVSSINDRYIDLAIAANFFAHPPALENLLLDTYFGYAPTLHQLARFNVMKALCRFVYAEKFLQIALNAQPADDAYNRDINEVNLLQVGALLKSGDLSVNTCKGQWLYGKALLNEAIRQINDDVFMGYLSCLC
jgi:thiamine kinase-like enzyme